jgi:hypothetical protein
MLQQPLMGSKALQSYRFFCYLQNFTAELMQKRLDELIIELG